MRSREAACVLPVLRHPNRVLELKTDRLKTVLHLPHKYESSKPETRERMATMRAEVERLLKEEVPGAQGKRGGRPAENMSGTHVVRQDAHTADAIVARLKGTTSFACGVLDPPGVPTQAGGATGGHGKGGAMIQYVYVRSEPGLWTVGFYRPDSRWESESDHGSTDEAAARVAWLNGSGDLDDLRNRVEELERAERSREWTDREISAHLNGMTFP